MDEMCTPFTHQKYLSAGNYLTKNYSIEILTKENIQSYYQQKEIELTTAQLKEFVFVVDCPGYGFAKANDQEKENWKKLMNEYFTHSSFIHRVVCLIDSKAGISENDKILFNMLEEWQQFFFPVLTKADKLSDANLNKKMRDISHKLRRYSFCSPILHATSNGKNYIYGIEELRANLIFIFEMKPTTMSNPQIPQV